MSELSELRWKEGHTVARREVLVLGEHKIYDGRR